MSNKTETPTIEAVYSMTDEEVANLNKKLMKRFAIKMAITAVVTVVAAVAVNKLAEKDPISE